MEEAGIIVEFHDEDENGAKYYYVNQSFTKYIDIHAPNGEKEKYIKVIDRLQETYELQKTVTRPLTYDEGDFPIRILSVKDQKEATEIIGVIKSAVRE